MTSVRKEVGMAHSCIHSQKSSIFISTICMNDINEWTVRSIDTDCTCGLLKKRTSRIQTSDSRGNNFNLIIGILEIFTCSMLFQILIWHIWLRMNKHDHPTNDRRSEIDCLTTQRVSTDWKDKQLPCQQLAYLLLLVDSQELWNHQTNQDQDNSHSVRDLRTSTLL